jgi:hypothetical protein
MKRRFISFLAVALMVTVVLSGCGNNPDTLYKKGKYAEAYPEFIKRAGTQEMTMKQETTNGSFSSRNSAANQAIHDFYYAADCQKKLGNNSEAAVLFQRVVDLSKYQIRIPSDKGALLKDSMEKLARAAREVRNQEVSYGQAYRAWENTPTGTGSSTDPYENTPTTDPYENTPTTDPYDTPSSDPYDTPSSDPYANTPTTDPYSDGTRNTRGEAPSRYWLDNAVSNLRTAQRDFERLMFSATKEEIPSIASIKSEYDRFSRALDGYLMYGAPGGLMFSPDSTPSGIAWRFFEGNIDAVTRQVYSAQGVVTYTSQPLQLKEANLVLQAQSALRELGVAATATAPSTSQGTTSGVTPVTVDSTGNSPYSQ